MRHEQHMTIEKWFFLLLTGVVIYLFWRVIEPFAFVILTATVTTIIVSPIDRFLMKYLKHQKLSAAILSFCVLALVFLPLLIVLILTAGQASDLIKTSINNNWFDKIEETASPLLNALPNSLQEEIRSIDLGSVSKAIATWSFQNVGQVFSSSTRLILNTILFFICLFYLIADREKLYDEVLALSPLRDSIDAKILKRVVGTVRSVVFGVLIVAIIQGILAGIGMTIFGVPGSLIWGALTILAALMPVVGTGLVLIPAILYLFFTGSTTAAVGLLIWSVVFVSLADNFIGPYLISGTTKMHSFLVLLSVLGGLTTFGPVGAIGGPTILAALLALIDLYKSGILTTGKIEE
ncbi:MAG: AI-2E family transporter [Parcubacteria group bacterium]|nr:AI-2E family transporter [Parcubacteria group bacterium]